MITYMYVGITFALISVYASEFHSIEDVNKISHGVTSTDEKTV